MYLELNPIEPLSRFLSFLLFSLLFSFLPPGRERAQSHRRGTIFDVGRDLRIDFHPADFRLNTARLSILETSSRLDSRKLRYRLFAFLASYDRGAVILITRIKSMIDACITKSDCIITRERELRNNVAKKVTTMRHKGAMTKKRSLHAHARYFLSRAGIRF